ncbi:MAG: right-handed parallel beta-helix repeat-containing protein [Acidobacteria bacterium]|nr:right-handed parallel beta-helix repeat-containing protein [Planctomycetota bacterium]MBE3131867.1 right-handed parallel beta-helix repeat-containing protein [Acidobacteriota bacterium]
MRNFLSISPALVFLLAVAGPGRAATCHVDWDKGEDVAGAGTVAKPWKSPWYADKQIQPGDTVIVHARRDGGAYFNGNQPVIGAQTPKTVWKAAPGEVVRLSLTREWGKSRWEEAKKGGTTVSVGADHVTVDGFHIWGSLYVGTKGDDVLIENCDLSGGPDFQGFPAVLRTRGDSSEPWDLPENVTIRNCKLHDNLKAMGQGPNNDAALLLYSSRNVIVENCEFYRTLRHAIMFKARPDRYTIRNNYFHDLPNGVEGATSAPRTWSRIHNNLFANCESGVGPQGSNPDGFFVYNNTFYNCKEDIYWWYCAANFHFFNNIHYHTDGGGKYQKFDERWEAGRYSFLDFNNYYTANATTQWFLNGRDRASDLASWRAYLKTEGAGPAVGERNSRSDDPGFLNASGKFEKPEDFKRKTCPKDGRGGDWPAVMGAYSTGDEVIGPLPRKPARGTGP